MTRKFLKLDLGGGYGKRCSLSVMRETAEFFGWDEAFPLFLPLAADQGQGSYQLHWGKNYERFPGRLGGQRLRICRVKRKQGHPAGMTHCFRIQGNVTNRMLQRMAVIAGDKFEWMEKKNGARVDREDWLSAV